ncbi:unnamed protein product [Rotaria sp. Silwood1]|nr:unnamed protein product [Rotaria sp. Silwood1]
MFRAAIILSQQYNITIDGQFIGWQLEETNGNIINALSKSCQAVSRSNIVGIVGPGLSREAHLIADFGKTIGIPVISPSVTDPDLSDHNAYPNFYRIVPSDNSRALAIVKLFHLFNWTSCILIYQNDAFGSGAAKRMDEAFNNNNLIIEKFIIFDINILRIRGDLKTYLTNSATRIVIVWVQSNYVSIVLKTALQADVLGPLFTWILSSSISLDSFNKTYHDKLLGLFSIEPVTASIVNASINTTLLKAAYKIWKQYEPESFPRKAKVNSYSLFAFDATWSLILSLEKLYSTITNNSSSCLSFVGSSYCFDRRFVHSNLLLNALSTIDFLGVSGPIKFIVNVTDRINGSYYYVQNVQHSSNGLSLVPVLQYSDSSDWTMFQGTSVIIWPYNSLIAPSGRATLKGVHLRIGVIESAPFTIQRNVISKSEAKKEQLIGYVPDLIKLLENRIGFISDIQIVPSNVRYNDLIQAVENGTYDIVIGDVTVTATRRQSVDFSDAIFDNSLSIIMRKSPDIHIDLLSFLNTFSTTLWLLVLGSFIYAGLLICLVERNHNAALKDRPILSQLGMSIWYSFGNIIGYGADFHVSTSAGRLVTAGLYMLCLILVATFTANLTSDLTISKTKGIVSGIDDIKKGIIPLNRIGIRDGTASEDYFLREISANSRSFYSVQTQNELYDRLLDGTIDAVLFDTSTAEYSINNIYCNLTLIGDGFNKGVFGIVTPKEWLYGKDLDVNILLLRESGELEMLRKKWFQTNHCPHSYETSTSKTVDSMRGLFLVFAITTFLSLLLFIWSNRSIFKIYLSERMETKRQTSATLQCIPLACYLQCAFEILNKIKS